jgi:hypothetical protein
MASFVRLAFRDLVTRRYLILLLAAAAATGCSSSAKTSTSAHKRGATETKFPAAGPPFLVPGEKMTYRVLAHDMTLAGFAIEVGKPKTVGDRQVIVVQAAAESTGVAAIVKPIKAEFATWLDAKSGEPIAFRVRETAGRDDEEVETNETRFDELAEGKFPIVTTKPNGSEVVETQTLGQPTKPIDLITFLMAQRGWDGPDGDSHTIDVVRSRYMWRTVVTLTGRASIVTELGQLPAVKFVAKTSRLMRDGTLDKGTASRHFSVWISDDADRVPLLLVAESDYGDIRLEIVDYTAGNLVGAR